FDACGNAVATVTLAVAFWPPSAAVTAMGCDCDCFGASNAPPETAPALAVHVALETPAPSRFAVNVALPQESTCADGGSTVSAPRGGGGHRGGGPGGPPILGPPPAPRARRGPPRPPVRLGGGRAPARRPGGRGRGRRRRPPMRAATRRTPRRRSACARLAAR